MLTEKKDLQQQNNQYFEQIKQLEYDKQAFEMALKDN